MVNSDDNTKAYPTEARMLFEIEAYFDLIVIDIDSY